MSASVSKLGSTQVSLRFPPCPPWLSLLNLSHAPSTVRHVTALWPSSVILSKVSCAALNHQIHLYRATYVDGKEVPVPIITISRGSSSGGKMLAESVAKRLGYRCVDREQIIQKAAAWGVSQNDLRIPIEKPPTFLGQSQHTKYLYLAFIQAALTEEVRTGNAIYHGLAGHLLLARDRTSCAYGSLLPWNFASAGCRNG